jgi:chromate transporter
MHQELVERRRWISEKRFLHALNYCMLLPGPEAQQLATYIGWLMHRTWGGVIAGALFVLPSLFILIGLSWVYVALARCRWWRDFLWHQAGGHRHRRPRGPPIGSRALKNGWLWAMAGASFGHLRPQRAVPADRAGGCHHRLCGRSLRPGKFVIGGGHGPRRTAMAGPDR